MAARNNGVNKLWKKRAGKPAAAPAPEDDYAWMQLPAAAPGPAAEQRQQKLRGPQDNGVRPEDPALLHAAAQGNIRALCAQINAGTDLEVRSKEGGLSALHIAARNSRDGVCNVLLTRGADVRAVASGGSGDTPLHQAAAYANSATVLALLEVGADPDAANSAGDTPLHCAVRARNTATARDLACHGASASLRNRAGDTALHLAAAAPAAGRCLLVLLEAGADPAAATDGCGRSPLHVATSPAAVGLLLKAGACTDACDELLRTPLHAAAERHRVRVAELLLRAGADPAAQDVDGRCPLELTGSAEMHRLLRAPAPAAVPVVVTAGQHRA